MYDNQKIVFLTYNVFFLFINDYSEISEYSIVKAYCFEWEQ